MIWQDIIIAICLLTLGFALIPTILNKHKPEPSTSGLYAGAITVLTVTFVTLGLWFSAFAQGFCALLWYILLVQVLLIKRRKK